MPLRRTAVSSPWSSNNRRSTDAMTLYQRFLRKPEFGSYEDFLHNFRINGSRELQLCLRRAGRHRRGRAGQARPSQWAHMDGREQRPSPLPQIARLSKQAANLLRPSGHPEGRQGDAGAAPALHLLDRHHGPVPHRRGGCARHASARPKRTSSTASNCAGIKMVVTSAEGCFAARLRGGPERMPDGRKAAHRRWRARGLAGL